MHTKVKEWIYHKNTLSNTYVHKYTRSIQRIFLLWGEGEGMLSFVRGPVGIVPSKLRYVRHYICIFIFLVSIDVIDNTVYVILIALSIVTSCVCHFNMPTY